EAVNEVLEDTKAAAARAGKEKEWFWSREHDDICRQGVTWINKHPELLNRLPDKIREAFQDRLVRGQEPRLFFDRRTGLHVRSTRGLHEGNRVSAEPAGVGHNSDTGFSVPTWRIIDPAKFPRRSWLFGQHYMRKSVSCTTAPGGMGKSSNALTEAISMA